MKPTIEKIVLKIGGKTIELSPEEARELMDVLNETLTGVKHTFVTMPYTSPAISPGRPDPYDHWTYSEDTDGVPVFETKGITA